VVLRQKGNDVIKALVGMSLALCLAVSCARHDAVDPEETAAEIARVAEAREMVARLGAVTDWADVLENNDKVLTCTLEAAMRRSGGPILYVGTVEDVLLREGRPYVLVKSWRYRVEIVGMLECDPPLAGRVVQSNPDGMSECAFVVEPTSLERMLWGAWSDQDTDDVYVSDGEVRLLRGRLVDLTSLGFADYEP
jgi:hypothetical protein